MEYRLLIELEVIAVIDTLPKSVRRRLFDHLVKIHRIQSEGVLRFQFLPDGRFIIGSIPLIGT